VNTRILKVCKNLEMFSLSRILSHSRSFVPILPLCLLIVLALCFGAQSALAQTETVLYSFAGGTSDGQYPYAGVIIDSTGHLYGTTTSGGSHSDGIAYELTSGTPWTEKVLYNFGGTGDGVYPYSGLLFDSSGNLYGTTFEGGSGNGGAFYELSSGTPWTESGLFSFTGGAVGQNPYNYPALIEDSSGNFYGTVNVGGAHSQGMVFKLSLVMGTWTETAVYSFDNTTGNDGDYPRGGLVMDSSGTLYGTTVVGGTNNLGTVFAISSAGLEKVLWNFGGTNDGSEPYPGLIIDSNGNLYGTTSGGGAHCNCGTVFELSPGTPYTEKVLYSFGGTGDGTYPYAGVIMDSSGNLYGTTEYGGAHNDGIVFKLALSSGTWSESWKYSFAGGTSDGALPYSGSLAMDSSGNLYGTTEYGGAHSVGVVFKVVP
jgi:uncharacterized repeat protein (TIGR03803 family)